MLKGSWCCLGSSVQRHLVADRLQIGLWGNVNQFNICRKSIPLLRLNEKEQHALRWGFYPVLLQTTLIWERPRGELPSGAADLEIPQQKGWNSRWVGRCISFYFYPRLVGSQERHEVVCIYVPSDKQRIHNVWLFFLKEGSLFSRSDSEPVLS